MGLRRSKSLNPIVQDDAEADLRAEVMEDLHLVGTQLGDGMRMNASIGWLVAERSTPLPLRET